MKGEIQVLKDSSMVITSCDDDFPETQGAVTNLQGTLAFKEKELSELHNEIDDLSCTYTKHRCSR